MKKAAKHILFLCLTIIAALAFTACSGSDKGTSSAGKTAAKKSVSVYICADYVSEEGSSAVADRLKERLGGDTEVSITCISTSGADPTMQMGSIMKVSMGLAAGEIDIIIADEDNAARNARSEAFCALSTLLSEEQIAGLGDRALSYEKVDEEGNTTGEFTEICGIDITDSGIMDGAVPAGTSMGMFVAGNAPNTE